MKKLFEQDQCDQCGAETCLTHRSCRVCKHFLFVLVAGVLVIYIFALAISTIKKYSLIGKPEPQSHNISITGNGKVTGVPNIAMIAIGLVTEKNDVSEAQNENTKKMNALIGAIKKIGIVDGDIQTAQYQIYPKYSYAPEGSKIIGYSVTQSINVKIRDLTKVSSVLAEAGRIGTNQVSGVQFTIDDPANLKSEARAKAIKNAWEKAEKTASALGARVVRVVGYNEFIETPELMLYKANGVGGGLEADSVASPNVSSGSLEITSEVSVIFEIE